MRAPRAFSLVELLVVVAILSLLLSVLLPSTQRAREMGRRLQCQANLRQIAQAAATYHSGANGRLPRIHPDAWPGWERIRFNSSALPCFNDALRPFINSEEIWSCPQAHKCSNNAWNKRRLDYGVNHYGRGTGETGRYLDTFDGQLVHRVARATAITFADAENDSSPEDIGGVARGTMDWPIHLSFERYAWVRHMGGYCAVQLDGSAVWYPCDPPGNDRWFIHKK